MARIFITGSADGLGLMAAKILIDKGNDVVLHARNETRVQDALMVLKKPHNGIAGELSSIAEVVEVAKKANSLGPFDAVIHNAGIGYREPMKKLTKDGLPEVFAVNSLAPYILTSLMVKPKRLIYLSSALHRFGDPTLSDVLWSVQSWDGFKAYSDSKLYDLILSQAVARYWKDVYSNAVEPGWVATKMGGPFADDILEEGPKTQVWLAEGTEADTQVSGFYFYHQQPIDFLKAAAELETQERFLELCQSITGFKLDRT